MHPIPQYTDLTEISGVDSLNTEWYRLEDGIFTKAIPFYQSPRVRFIESMVETELAFAVSAPHNRTEHLINFGFTHIASCHNWYPAHAQDTRVLKLWWKKYDRPNLKEAPLRETWADRTNVHGSSYATKWEYARAYARQTSSGCGVLLDNPGFDNVRHLPYDGTFWKYFCILRQPLKISRKRSQWLKKLKFWKITDGTQASYWTNGWPAHDKAFNRDRETGRWGGWAGVRDIYEGTDKDLTQIDYAREAEGPWPKFIGPQLEK